MNTQEEIEKAKWQFLQTETPLWLITATFLAGATYFIMMIAWFLPADPLLFLVFFGGQLFHFCLLTSFLYTIADTEGHRRFRRDTSFTPPVDVYITVAGEPVSIIAQTVRGAKAMDYPNFTVYVLNDSLVAHKENWADVQALAAQEGIECITRQRPGGAKAGNINNALWETQQPFIVIFDADHIPHRDFLAKTMPYFVDEKLAFVQTPQFYKNFNVNYITKAAWEQQAIFFGPICKGKNSLGAAPMCGTNVVIRRSALEAVGGFQRSITEDFPTGLAMQQKGYTSLYLPEVLAEGLAPQDFMSYYRQQFRWARGGLEMTASANIFTGKLRLSQRIQYLSSLAFYISASIVLFYALLPIVSLVTGATLFRISSAWINVLFVAYFALTFYTLRKSTNSVFSFRSFAFSMCLFSIHIKALIFTLLRKKTDFQVTSKRTLRGNFLGLVWPQIAYCVVAIVAIAAGFAREGPSDAVLANSAWAIFYTVIFSQFIVAAQSQPKTA